MVDSPTRPMTHDLFANVLASWSLDVEKVVIKEVNEHTLKLDIRPSDASL